jgi:glucosamine--fructose-6-phosphate aminotransferase (isomerizing)
MCGIVGYVGARNATPVIYDGLKRLEYRGYDSAGIAVIQNDHIEVRREAGKLDALRDLLYTSPIAGSIGIGHTRWATHGKANQLNAHPHLDCTGDLVVIHNGIVENFLELRSELASARSHFSQRDRHRNDRAPGEAVHTRRASFEEAVRHTLNRLHGAQAVVLMNRCQPDRLITARIGNAGGVTIGLGDGEMFLASDMPAILDYTRKVVFLESRQMAIVLKDGLQILSLDGDRLEVPVHSIPTIRLRRPRANIATSCRRRIRAGALADGYDSRRADFDRARSICRR